MQLPLVFGDPPIFVASMFAFYLDCIPLLAKDIVREAPVLNCSGAYFAPGLGFLCLMMLNCRMQKHTILD